MTTGRAFFGGFVYDFVASSATWFTPVRSAWISFSNGDPTRTIGTVEINGVPTLSGPRDDIEPGTSSRWLEVWPVNGGAFPENWFVDFFYANGSRGGRITISPTPGFPTGYVLR